jgi:hypothetical protein
MMIYVACALTPKYPVIIVCTSYAHHSEHAIIVYGIPIFKYSFKPIYDLLSGKKTACFISSVQYVNIRTIIKATQLVNPLAIPVPKIP